MNAAPTHARLTYASRRLRHGPPNSPSTSIANDPKAAKIDVCGCAITLSASAKTAGITIAARAALFSAARSGTVDDDKRFHGHDSHPLRLGSAGGPALRRVPRRGVGRPVARRPAPVRAAHARGGTGRAVMVDDSAQA